ncbi:MAG: type I-U CRISPR-associated helicase/endonuclease Cas3 [Armatimonadetes bacterium]|nr:type I-U CRISPR-associated helicase/endonuclease Cas3 [Armatimonadota bacterium]
MHSNVEFDIQFKSLTGNSPFPWHRTLFGEFIAKRFPKACDIPTGLGKTSVIPIWLIALVSQYRGCGTTRPLPRRLVYVVNRRTVVDQATEVIEQMRERLRNPGDDRWAEHKETLSALRRGLQEISATGDEDHLVGVSTLRGELADNEEWKVDPTRPAIIIGTIDMIGSPAFSDLLRRVADLQRQDCELRAAHVVELSATLRNGADDGILQLGPEDEKVKTVIYRLDAAKYLRLHEVAKSNATSKLVELALQHDKTLSKVLIYVQSPEDAHQVAELLRKRLGRGAYDRVALLTGTIRGYERDRRMNAPVFRAMLDRESRVERTVYLTSTSAGEVGINIDADHMVCDGTTLDSMIQRLGRVNRSGGDERAARIDVVWAREEAESGDNKSDMDNARAATFATFRRWAEESGGRIDASPRKLRKLVDGLSDDERTAAFSPKPEIPLLTDILLDAWSLTSVDSMPGMLGVAAYLHGLTHDPPETYVVWRKEVMELHKAKASAEDLRDWFHACRIESRERLRDRSDRVKKVLGDLLKAHRRSDNQVDFPVVLLDERGIVKQLSLSKIVEKEFGLGYRTVVLPLEVGGLDTDGMLDYKVIKPMDGIDVAEASAGNDHRERWLHIRSAEGERCKRLLTDESALTLPPALREKERICMKQHQEGVKEEGEEIDLVLMMPPREVALENPEIARNRQTLVEHTNAAAEHMVSITKRLGLEKQIQDALVTAARWHDRGKDSPVWQRYACNQDCTEPLAKSTKYLSPRAMGGYRHELGSLLEAMGDTDLQQHAERDLVLHLITTHHGWARPHFEPRAFDHTRTTTENTEAATEVMRRFGRLQQRFGHWGLAWLESLLRCADIAASKVAFGGAMRKAEEQEVPT